MIDEQNASHNKFEDIDTEWNRKAQFINKDGGVELEMILPPHVPEKIVINNKTFKLDLTATKPPFIFREVVLEKRFKF